MVRIRQKEVTLSSRSAVTITLQSWADTQRVGMVRSAEVPLHTCAKEHSMMTQTRRTTRRSAKFFRTTGTASMVTACCGLVLWSVVVAHAGTPRPGHQSGNG